jgi:2-polyprenyl-6-hydroxyphenyl methylase/3-demethylubiquinone-9 3-methyltransferase
MAYKLAMEAHMRFSANVPSQHKVKSPVRTFVDWNVSAARALDRMLLPDQWRVSHGREFSKRVVPELLRPGMNVWDVGCGSRPMISRETKRDLGLTITGIDIDAGELDMMGPGLCDRTITADVCEFFGDESADLVICRTVLEHVHDVDRAFAGLVSMLRPCGTLAICVPCRNAPFARLNLLLPERTKRRLLFGIWPHKGDGHTGFPARYHRCTPRYFTTLAERHRLRVVELSAHWWSNYFTFFLPVWALWRLWQVCARTHAGDNACEGFVLVATTPRKEMHHGDTQPYDRSSETGTV